ncbi:ankyrin repeat-containing domain protein [Schizophyllum amplum]|uniref:Ankyrin repeat-containing domain protein n=1 Tax=Schizophyllum amplum TaxID=97359 RepID=A0A550CFP8_9AGAR|nr:ankyrin repeat-containing domain protein [Auriculariopsis ampla]
MSKIILQAGYLSTTVGGQTLRNLYFDGSSSFEASKLTPFGFYCYLGEVDLVKQAVESGNAPDIEGTETPYEFGYITLTVSGGQRVQTYGKKDRHDETLRYLFSVGAPVDLPDIAGYTALQHVTMNHTARIDLARILIEEGRAAVNHRNRYGEVALMLCFHSNIIPSVDLLMEHGAEVDVADADGITPRNFMIKAGPQVVACMQKWLRKRSGETRPMENTKRCDACGTVGKDAEVLKMCAKCRTVRYCNATCQRAHWPSHKTVCRPFSADNCVTVKPYFTNSSAKIQPSADLMRSFLQIPAPPTPTTHRRHAHVPKSTPKTKSAGASASGPAKNLIVKVQVPINLFSLASIGGPAAHRENGPMMLYTKKRDLVCDVLREGNGEQYDRLWKTVVDHGVGGAKAYFAAELRSREELVIKLEPLAEQPF